MAKPEDVKKEDGKAFEVPLVEILSSENYYIHQAYSFKKEDVAKIGPTGQLIAFRIVSTEHNRPRFLGRWDQNKDLIDIDVENVGMTERSAFRRDADGYGPHQGRKIINPDQRRLIQFDFSF